MKEKYFPAVFLDPDGKFLGFRSVTRQKVLENIETVFHEMENVP
jgi:hypothetical protein